MTVSRRIIIVLKGIVLLMWEDLVAMELYYGKRPIS